MDIISALSDDLLLRILSFVPTKDVVATSLLSKRWRSLWKSVSKLAYDDSDHTGDDYNIFSQFVYRSLLSNKAPVLDKLHLKVGADCPFIDIGLWIDIALSRRVRELQIDVHSKDVSLFLPSSLYTSETLEILTLRNCVVLSVPCSVRLPSLKTLTLELVDYIDNDSLPRLLSGCPNLEVLFVERHDGDATTESIVVAPAAPSLQRLTMLDAYPGTSRRFVVVVPSLKYLKIADDVAYDLLQMENMPELLEASVCITNGVTPKFLKAITSAHRLSLSLSLSEVMHPSGMIFNQLVHLDLCTLNDGWWDLLTCMLIDSPKLRFLKLSNSDDLGGGDCGKETPIGWMPPSSVPECLLSSLEAFVWIGYNGRQGDREMAVFLLKNAACLKTARFSPDSTDLEEKYQMLKVLASVPTTSASSQLLFD